MTKVWIITVSSLLLQGFSALQYLLIKAVIENGSQFAWQFYLFLCVSMLISLFIGIFRRSVLLAMTIRLFLIFLIGYPMGTQLWLELTLLLSLLIETGLFLSPPWNLALMLTADLSLVFFQKPVNAFYRHLPGPHVQDLLFFFLFSLIVTFLLFALSRQWEDGENRGRIIRRQDEALSLLGKANLGFQDLNTSLKLDTLKKERNRVSREIHDTVGYSLTNIRIMLEAASFMVDSDTPQTKELIEKSMNEASICLEETRNAMRLLRSKEIHIPKGMKSLYELIRIFGNATGIQMKLELGNVPDSFGERIDKAIYRFIQEGLTNSFRHGRATTIAVYFWIHERVLKVSLQDNGTGSQTITEGIGLNGMKERISELNGIFSYQNLSDGFEISIRIPLRREDK
ncbi:MAG: hypothetical protein B6241_07835 [Spirochaetaceae bacterium 4572_59]|nr:MAG: hypothetical protein B6241_07835 [Spirochaetaceae bacterium 4572_59]